MVLLEMLLITQSNISHITNTALHCIALHKIYRETITILL